MLLLVHSMLLFCGVIIVACHHPCIDASLFLPFFGTTIHTFFNILNENVFTLTSLVYILQFRVHM